MSALLLAVTLVAASGASAASPMDICKDLQDGKLDGTYTSAELQAYMSAVQSDPTMQGYCSPIFVVTTPGTTSNETTTVTTAGTTTTVNNTTTTVPGATTTSQVAGTTTTRRQGGGGGTTTSGPTPPRTSAVAGASKTKTSPPQQSAVAPVSTTRKSGTLPFTGAELAVFAIVGGALLGAGLLLRATNRGRREDGAR